MKNVVFNIVAVGALATVAFDVFGQALSPMVGHANLAPVGLAGAAFFCRVAPKWLGWHHEHNAETTT